ncbi:DUF190 domain-containing protein [Neisseriaceae bacterium TC5R-5]|nr:DUF190 domain-containing protein [Neisseriaceae bacterium TC5R-5]
MMQGYQLTFFTLQNRQHGEMPLGDWLIQEARKLGAGGATLIVASQGFGHERKLHSAHFFELTEQPIEVKMVLSETDTERLFQRLREEKIDDVLYVKAAVEFGRTMSC